MSRILHPFRCKMTEVIGPPHYRVLTFEETCLLYKSTSERTRDIEMVLSNEKEVIPVEIHKAVVEKIQTDDNIYATTKSTSQGYLNTTIFQSQIFQLVSIIQYTLLRGWDIALIVFICLSLCLQFVIFVLIVLLAKSKTEQVTKNCTATAINNLVTSLTGVLLIITISISAMTKIAGPSLGNSTSALRI